MTSSYSPIFQPLSSPPLRGGTPPFVLADRIIRSRKGNPPHIQLSEMSEEQIEMTIDCLVEANGLTDAFLLNAIGSKTKRLNLTSCYHIRKYSLGMIAQQCCNLEVINLSNCRQVDNKVVTTLLAKCLKIKQLTLDGCARVTDAALSGIPRNLRKLSLSGCRQITEEALIRIAETCRELEEMNLAGCRNSVTKSVVHALFDLASSECKLKILDISDCAVLASDDVFVQYQLKLEFSSKLLPLQVIRLAGQSGLPPKYTWKSIQAIANMCGPNLVELDTTWSFSVNDQACYALASNCPNLKTLRLCNSQITANGLEILSASLLKLESLDLSWCLKVDAKAVQIIASTNSCLKELKLSHCIDFLSSKSNPISPKHILELIERCGNKLEKLELTGLPKLVSPELLSAISLNCCNLTCFTGSLGGETAGEIRNALEQFSRNCELIENLTIDVSRIQFTDEDLLSQAFRYPNLPNLKRLSLSANPKTPFGDSLLESVLGSRIGLEHLELRNCRDLSPELFQTWIQGYTPDRETALVVGAMLDADLSESEAAPTVIFRGRFLKEFNSHVGKKARNNTATLSGSYSETDNTIAQGFEMIRNSIVLNDPARAMDSLKSLTLVGASKFTDASLDRLSLMMGCMQHLEIIDAPLVQEEAAEPIRRRCRLLRALEITGPKLRVRIDSSRFVNRRRRRKALFPSKSFIAMKRKLSSDDDNQVD